VNRGVGGGHKQRIRVVDFHRLEAGPHDVVRIEYDPGRSGHIALVHRRGAATERVSPDEGAILADTEASDEQYHGATRAKRNEVKGGWSYILAPDGLRAGDVVQSYRSGIPEDLVEGWADAIKEGAAKAKAAADGEDAQINSHSTAIRALGMMRMLTIKPGNVLPLSLIPAGTIVHNISLRADGRMALCRSAGTFGQVVAHHGPQGQALGGGEVLHMGGVPQPDGTYSAERGSVLVKLQSGEVRRIGPSCIATVGVVSK
jgi:ribosomal protein L2